MKWGKQSLHFTIIYYPVTNFGLSPLDFWTFWKNGLVDLKSMDGSKVDCLFFFSCVGTKAPPAAKMPWLTVFRPSVVKQMSTETFADLMIKSKLSACGGSTAMRQLSPIY